MRRFTTAYLTICLLGVPPAWAENRYKMLKEGSFVELADCMFRGFQGFSPPETEIGIADRQAEGRMEVYVGTTDGSILKFVFEPVGNRTEITLDKASHIPESAAGREYIPGHCPH